MKRISLFYIGMLVVAGTAIFGALHLGSSLSPPAGQPLTVETGLATVPSQTGAMGVLEGLRGNLEHPLSHLLLQLLVIIVASRLMGRAFRRMGQPAVIGEMAAGIVLGPSLFGWLAPGLFDVVFPQDSLGTLRLLSQIGVCLFMFAVGMDLNVEHVRSRAHAAVAVSHASIVLPYLLGVLLAYFLFDELAAAGTTFTAFALFMGISMSITAFPVLARILQERGLSRTWLGSTALTCAAVDDVTAWSILAFVVAVARASSVAGSLLSLVLVLAFVGAMILIVRPLLRDWIGGEVLDRDEPPKGVLALIVCLVVGAALTTEVIGIHALFGAFLAGAVMPDVDEFRRRIHIRVESFSSVLLLPLFFAFTGLRTQLGLLDDLRGWLVCLVIVIVATLGKLGGSALAGRLTGMRWREALQLGALMNTRGLMELIALNIGYDLGILSPRIFTMLVIMALVTTALTGPLLTLFGRQRPADARIPERSHA
jgi:Kef-type K+ transport system membrane component KefB